jgi:5'-AMP-activated protein kinase regulatory beta subunit
MLGSSAPARAGDMLPHAPSSLTSRVRAIVHDAPAENDSLAEMVAPVQKIETVPTLFKWNGGGNTVYLSGSFNNWQGKILMQRTITNTNNSNSNSANNNGTSTNTNPSQTNNTNEFQLYIDIPPGTHQYKFIVDEEWRVNPDQPTTTNPQGVVNNIIDVKRPVFEDNLSFADSDEEELDENKQKIVYGQRIPTQEEYVKDPPKIPPQLGSILLSSPLNPADPYVLPMPQHVTLNHLYVYGQGRAGLDQDFLVAGITQRFKTKSFAAMKPKFVTTVYYTPKPQLHTLPSTSTTPSSVVPVTSSLFGGIAMNQQTIA